LSGAARENEVRAWTRALIVAGVVVALDQVTKQIAVDNLAGRVPVDLPLSFELTIVHNTGIAFGRLGGDGVAVSVFAALTVIGLMVWLAVSPTRPLLWLAVGLLVGGALGNLADRARLGAVIDFVDPPLWPTFNLADVAVTAGVLILIFTVIRPEPG
jgi:signal peptidase II